EAALASGADELAPFGDHLPSYECGDRPTLEFLALVRRVIHRVVDHRLADGHFLVRIPNRQVGVAADRYAALARIQTIEFGGVGPGQRDEFWKIDTALADAFRKEERSPYLEAGDAIRYLFEGRISAMLHLPFRIVVAVAGVIGREDVEHPADKSL